MKPNNCLETTDENISQPVPADHTDNSSALKIVSKQFLCGTPVRSIRWHDLFERELSWDEQAALLDVTVDHPLVRRYPLSAEYQAAFLKYIITKLSSMNVEQHDRMYENYCAMLSPGTELPLDDPSIGLSYKHYELPHGQGVISLKESSAFVSDGTTGLCSWQAAKALCEHISNNRDDFHGRNILELGSGVGLSGIYLAKCYEPSIIVMSDCHSSVLTALKENVRLNFPNAAPVECDNPLVSLLLDSGNTLMGVMDLDWQYISASNLSQLIEPDVIVAADIVYDHTLFPALLSTLNYIFCLSNNRCKFVLACTERNQDTLNEFLQLLITAKFRINEETVSPSRHFHWDSSASNIRIFTITRAFS
ncbi:protein-lysine N-methyltransferase EEF2KMT [Anopheles funestus]|uniref:protein-lysine N-methyltransferase EEF2KMT n=1 Tax=Anopheles funestus TaxID=62324 RepID=UPI0020C68ABA|nr:protein-lysine N-methyltransferase EEF2KMT [Anopheles funestus]XP_049287626.1 protein-lysine N-methyltransferase EEF2KMT [Anopheles funestus]